jgi:hypothetical protein
MSGDLTCNSSREKQQQQQQQQQQQLMLVMLDTWQKVARRTQE